MRSRIARSLVLAFGVTSAAPVLGGCMAQARSDVVVDAPPPPARAVRVEARPGFVWVDGSWISRGGRWAWRDGHWVQARPGRVYVQGTWMRRAGRWHWVEPRWETRAYFRSHAVRDGRERPARPDRYRRHYRD